VRLTFDGASLPTSTAATALDLAPFARHQRRVLLAPPRMFGIEWSDPFVRRTLPMLRRRRMSA
jgi:hypothetical protein